MKSSLQFGKLFAACLLACGVSSAFAEDLTVSEDKTLDTDKNVASFTIQNGAKLDLNGHNLTITSAFMPKDGAIACITNSSATLSKVLVSTPSRSLGSKEFTKVRFGGNLSLEVKDTAFTEPTGFAGIRNTHTGGTILNHVTSDGNKGPRINNASDLGSGDVTFKNGSCLRLITSNITASWPNIIVEGGTNVFCLEKNLVFKNKLAITSGSLLQFNSTTDSSTLDLSGADLTGVEGTLWYHSTGATTGNLKLETDVPGRIVLSGPAQQRYTGTANDNVWTVGDIASPDEETGPSSNYWIRVAGTDAKVVIGDANRNSTYWGSFKRETTAGHDWSFEKVGTGTWTLGGTNNTFRGNITLKEGAVRLTGTTKLTDVSTQQIVFDGGALIYADQLTDDQSAKFTAGSDTSILRLGVDAGHHVTLANSVTSWTGFEMIGDGTLTLADTAISMSKIPQVTAGVLELPVASTITTWESTSALPAGAGTYRFLSGTGSAGYRLRCNCGEFSGTLDFANQTPLTSAVGLMQGASNLGNVTVLVSGQPAELTRVVDFEFNNNQSVTIGALQMPNPNAMPCVKNNLMMTFGDKEGVTNIVNNTISNTTSTVLTLKKVGDTLLQVGPGFSMKEGGGTCVFNVTAGTLELLEGASQPSFMTIADDVILTGAGTFGTVDLSKHDLVFPETADKAQAYTLLNATSVSGDYTANTTAALAALNEAAGKTGKWVLNRVTADGVTSIRLAFLKSGCCIIFK